MDDKAKKAIRENLALTAKAIYHYEMMLLIPDDERLTYLTDNLQVSFKSGQKVGHLIEYGNRCSQYNNYIKEMSLCLDNKTHHGEALKMSNTPTNNLVAHLEHKVPASEVIYFDKEKSQDLERLAGIQFPRYYSSLSFNTIIQQPRCICNSKVPQHCDIRAEPTKKALEKGSVKEVLRKEATGIDQIGDAIVEERPHSPAVLQKGGDSVDGR